MKRPRAARTLTEHVWTAGYNESSRRVIRAGKDVLVVAGMCLATDAELRQSLNAARAERWYEVMSWPGVYVAMARIGGCTTVLGSLSGTSRVYYTEVTEGCLWSSAATPLAAYTGASIDYTTLVADMAAGGVEFDESPFEGVHAVSPGFCLVVDDGVARVRQWYRPAWSLTFEEGVSLLRERLLAAIERRAETLAVASGDFSGGFDSSTLLFLASRLCGVTGVTYADQWIGNDDLAYACAIARQIPALAHQIIQGGVKELEYAGLADGRDVPVTDLPTTDLTVLSRDRRMLASAKQLGSPHHFNGEGGDALFDASRMNYADQFMAGEHLRAFSGAKAYARRTRCSPIRMMGAVRRLSRTQQTEAMHKLAVALRTHVWRCTLTRYDTLSWCLALPTAGWLSDRSLEAVAGYIEGAAQTSSTYAGPGHYHDWLGVRYTARNSASVVALAESMGLAYDMPFLDTALVDACLSVPGYERMSLTQFKPLLQAAVPELPQALRQRTTKGSFDATAAQGVRHAAGWLRQFVRTSRLVQDGWLNGSVISAQLEREIAGLAPPSLALQQLVTRELWLQHVNLKSSSWWEDLA